jgi:hypothetical protein
MYFGRWIAAPWTLSPKPWPLTSPLVGLDPRATAGALGTAPPGATTSLTSPLVGGGRPPSCIWAGAALGPGPSPNPNLTASLRMAFYIWALGCCA